MRGDHHLNNLQFSVPCVPWYADEAPKRDHHVMASSNPWLHNNNSLTLSTQSEVISGSYANQQMLVFPNFQMGYYPYGESSSSFYPTPAQDVSFSQR